MKLFYDVSLKELKRWLDEHGETAYRAAQIFEWAYQHDVTSFEEMTNLPTDLRVALAEAFTIGPLEPVTLAEDEAALKALLAMPGGGDVECVAMRMEGYTSACLSSQVGCAVGCGFCASAMGGCDRNLTAGEIILQLITLRAKVGPIRNAVFMGMGEAFHNYEAVCEAIDRMTDKRAMGMSPGHITVSTCGVVPMIHRYAHEGPKTELAVSLGSADQGIRDMLMPGVSRWDLGDLMAACYDFSQARKGQPVTFAYVMLAGVNDQYHDVDRLARLLSAQPHHLNLIPYNEVPDCPYLAPDEPTINTFYRRCREAGLNVSVRRSRGQTIDAACGQLRRRAGV
ncbi:MAG: 23S rRNA (adenine(2503)-C(2))-methyltransferase RlmN [candidate division WS1 bacterium]|jgi:23S rRNA (adenine2503-C2)-methyltransferase|nr:23S rRNA (adenine(2503)-C(2))-methyltransferase RlmN [candidate division WS1 bacterium]